MFIGKFQRKKVTSAFALVEAEIVPFALHLAFNSHVWLGASLKCRPTADASKGKKMGNK